MVVKQGVGTFFNVYSRWFLALLLLIWSAVALCNRAEAAEIDVSVTTSASHYQNGEPLTYQITVKNNTAKILRDVSVRSDIASLTAHSQSQTVAAFRSSNISASSGFGSDSGAFIAQNADLDVVAAELFPFGSITYSVEAVVSDDIVEQINLSQVQVQADIDSDGSAESFSSNHSIAIEPAPYQYQISLDANLEHYQSGEQLVYTVSVENTGSYKIKGLSLTAPFASLTAASVHNDADLAFELVAISGSKSGSESELGDYAIQGDLDVENAAIAVGGRLVYTVTTKVNSALIGDITTQARAITRDGEEWSDVLTLSQAEPEITLSHTLSQSGDYRVNDEMVFDVSVVNSGKGIAHQYQVTQNISELVSNLGLANNLGSEFDSRDVSGNPFISWTAEVLDKGEQSLSTLSDSGSVQNQAFSDEITLFGGEAIDYRITAHVSSVAIGNIQGFNAKVLDSDNALVSDAQVSQSLAAEKVLSVDDSEIQISKTTSMSEYVPSNMVEYDLKVTNQSDRYFANNLQIVDDLSCVMTEQAGGAGQGQAFERWKVEVVSGDDEPGSDPGSFDYDSWLTTPVTLSLDLAPGKTMHYRLTAVVSATSVGTILDNQAGCNDNVSESGSGVQMPADNLRVSKDVDSRYYSPNGELTYTIRIDNDGDGFADQVRVLDDLPNIQSDGVLGGSVAAFSSWNVTAKAYREDGSDAESTETGIDGSLTSPDALDVVATIEPQSYVIYTIVAKVNPYANGHIQNSVTVDGTAYADRGVDPRDFTVEFNQTVKTNTDAGFHEEYSHYGKQEGQITYQIHVTNPSGNGYATNVEVKSDIDSVTASLLQPNNQSKAVFSSWTVSAEVFSDTPELLNYTDVGNLNDNQNLDAVAQIPPGVEVVYTIEATIDRSLDSQIVYGQFHHTASVETPDSSSQSGESETTTVYPREPDVVVVKLTDDEAFTPGEWVDFDITVFNRGLGFANEVHVSDDIIGMEAFSEWTINATTDSHKEPFGSGSRAGDKSGYPDNGNIDAYIDIDPKTSEGFGRVAFHIHARVKDDYAKPEIANTVEVYDPVNGLNMSASAEIGAEVDNLNVSIVKTADSQYFTPGNETVYSIVVLNNSQNAVSGLKLVDPLKNITAVLANNQDGHIAELEDQSPFEYWQFDYADGNGWQSATKDNLIYPLADGETFSLDAGEQREFKIKVKIKDNVIGSRSEVGTFSQIIRNDAYIYQHFNLVNQQSHVSHHEMRRAHTGADVERKLYVNGKESRYYKPGDTLTYTVKHWSNTGYANNRKVSEDLTGLNVQLSDRQTGHPFSDQFSVSVSKQDSHGGAGTTDGTLDGTVEDNQDIDTVIDIAGGDSVTYTVEGVVRGDAVGNITIGDLTVMPSDYHLTFSKTASKTNYQPGEPLEYHLTITNDGEGPAYNIAIEDALSKVTVSQLDGSTANAYRSDWQVSATIKGGSSAAQVDLDQSLKDGADINTHFSLPAGETVEYVVTTTVNANAVGDIYNYLKVDGDYVSSKTSADTQKYDFAKTLTQYLDSDKATELTGGYTPGGYIVYQIDLVNNNNVHIDSMPISDDIAAITTDYFDGTSGPAFSEWTVTTTTDSSGLSRAGEVADNHNIDTQFDIAANQFADSNAFVRYTVVAKVSEKAVGSIQNIALVNGTHKLISERASMLSSSIKKLHKAYHDDSFSEQKTSYTIDNDQRQVVYRLRLENQGKGTEYGAALKETFSSIKSKLAQNASGEIDDQTGAVYAPNHWNVAVSQSDELTTDIGGYTGGQDVDIDIPSLSIAPGGWVELVIRSEIRDDAMSAIAVVPSYRGANFAKSTLTPPAAKLSVEKSIVSIGGKSYTSGDVYRPGDEVVYRFAVTNTEAVWFDNAVLKDIVSNIKVEVLGGGLQPAFSSTQISHSISTGIDDDVDTYLPSYDASGNLNISADIAPGESVVFTIVGIIRDDALGDIDANLAVGGSQTVTTAPIPSVAADIVFEKSVINTTADGNSCSFPSTTGDGCQYNPSGQVSYQLSVENQGEGIANDVAVVDKLSDILTADGVRAFSSVTTTITSQPNEGRFAISGSYEGSVPLDASMDLMPGDKVVFVLTGIVDDSATGDITNIASVGGLDSNPVVLTEGSADIIANKSTDTPTYTPGGEVRYTLYVANRSDSNAAVNVVDEISKFMVETADGSEKTALSSWTVSHEFVTNAELAYNDASAISASGDINAEVHLGHAVDDVATVLKIDVVGTVRDDAIGKFGNVLYVDNKQFDLQQHFIYPQPGTARISKTATNTPATYAPGDTIGFDIQVQNTGSGYLTNLEIEDLVKDIKADVVDGLLPTHVIERWDESNSYLTITDVGASESYTVSQTDFNDSQGFYGVYQLAPGGRIDLHLEGVVASNAIGEIVNQVNVSAEGIETVNDSATYTPIDAAVTLAKSVDKDVYQSGDTLTYRLEIANTTRAWATDVKVTDRVDRISAESLFGEQISAFESDSIVISASSKTGATILPSSSHNYLDHRIDLAPSDTVTVTISGKLKPEIIGAVENIASIEFDGDVTERSVTSTPLTPTLSITKAPLSEYYAPGATNGFSITVQNHSASYANDVVVEDLISELLVDTVDDQQGASFSRWNQTVVAGSSATYIDNRLGWNEDVRYNIDLAPNDSVTITVEGAVNQQATGIIANTAQLDFNGERQSASAALKPQSVNLTLEKFVGESGSDTEMVYEPGVEATYRVRLTNTSDAFASGIAIKDLISELTVETISGHQEAAFSRWSISVNHSDELTTISPDPSGVNKDIDGEINLAPHDTIEFVITGVTHRLGHGVIENTATMVLNQSSNVVRQSASATLTPAPDNVTFGKQADSPIYVPGEQAVYRITLFNDSQGFATNVVVRDVMTKIKVQTAPDFDSGNRSVVNAFTHWAVEEKHGDDRTTVENKNSSENADLNSVVNIAPGDTVEFTITGTVDPRAMGEIVNTAFKITAPQDGETRAAAKVESSSVTITPRSVLLVVDKTADKTEYSNDDSELTYTLRVANQGASKVVGASMQDAISALAGSNGNPLFTTWTTTISEWPSGTVVGSFNDQDLDLPNSGLSLDLEPYMGNGYQIHITGTLNKGLDDDITNTFSVRDSASGESAADSVTVYVKKFADNEGELTVSKQALKTEAQVGDVIEYEVLVQNNNESEFKNVSLIDRYPGGFAYVGGSAQITNSGPDGQFDTADDVVMTDDPVQTNTLNFAIGDMLAYGSSGSTVTEQVRIRYLLRVSVGATFGQYTNTAWAIAPREGRSESDLVTKSNIASASVEITPDKLFDSASIIGKVFEDHNHDGYQADATARSVTVTADIPVGDYIQNSTHVKFDGVTKLLKDTFLKGSFLKDNNGSKGGESVSPLTGGAVTKSLRGVSLNRTLKAPNRVSYLFKTKTRDGFEFKVTTRDGTEIYFDRQQHTQTRYFGDRSKGLAAEKLKVSRHLYHKGDEYIWEIEIENQGIYEDGIPGVRLLTVEGVVIETDQYGRYHVPDQWVLNKKGKQFLVKLDTDSLPTGMKVLSENPLVKRISPNKLSKFNFSVVSEKE